MTTDEFNNVAAELVNDIKKCFKELKSNGKNNPMFNLEVWNCKRGGEVYYYVSFNNKEFGKFKNEYEVGRFFTFFRAMLNDLKKTRGYKYLIYEEREIGNYPCYYDIIEKVGLMDNPCKEYVKLQKYITKYGKYKLGEFELYSVNMFGKRGRVDCESGNRYYLDHNPKKCESILAEIRSSKGAKDKMVVEYIKDEIYIDEEEKRASSYYETECHGEKKSYLVIEIFTPSGKKKSRINIY